ncbi:dnaJ homolog subfamily C member 9 isoform X2 [Tenrec ecaudatus]|uniref:dnaJ homolog subfamily C member 9 isoform X2 n=1 Tax=Tenrec ecaudatus TaxID=94439 RepID=UPI003F5A365F
MGLLEQCEQVFGTADLYRVLGVRREASDGEVRRGYHKVSLQVHPDRVGEGDKEDATRRFQILGKVYAVLSDREQRAVYDEQGAVDEDAAVLQQERDWEAYWRLLFKKISLEDIQAFEKTYKGSAEELDDIKQAYLDFKGDMDRIMESVLCVQYTEEPRIRNIIQQAIDAGEVPSYQAFVREPKQKMSARKRRAILLKVMFTPAAFPGEFCSVGPAPLAHSSLSILTGLTSYSSEFGQQRVCGASGL